MKNKLAIICNFGPYTSVGGSEAVIKIIAEKLVEKYNYNVDIYAHNYNKTLDLNNIKLFPCPKGDNLIPLIAHNYSHIFVYSDSQWNWDDIVKNINKVKCGVSVALVGAYHMQAHPESFDLFKKHEDRFNLICHAKGIDYKWCLNNDLDHKIIPNGVDLAEFRENSIDFRKKYNIKEKYVILNVSNYFFGKGQEILPKIANKLSEKLDDFIILSISNSVDYPYDRIFLDRTKKFSKDLNIRFLRDLPREDVVAAFNQSDIFLMTSKKEVAPLVILESQAAGLPWVSMDVGNVKDHLGGVVIKNSNVDHKGYKIVGNMDIDRFCIHIAEILESDKIIERYKKESQQDIENIDWNNIIPLYYEVFKKI